MVSKTMVVKAAEGLHMRPAGVIAREAGKFESDVTIVFGDKNQRKEPCKHHRSMHQEGCRDYIRV